MATSPGGTIKYVEKAAKTHNIIMNGSSSIAEKSFSILPPAESFLEFLPYSFLKESKTSFRSSKNELGIGRIIHL